MSTSKKLFVILCAAMVCFFTGCSNSISKKNGSLVFDFSSFSNKQISRNAIEDLITQDQEFFVDLSLEGTFKYHDSFSLSEQTSYAIEGIPLGARIKAVIEIFTYKDPNDKETKIILFSGESQTYTISESVNQITVKLNKNEDALEIIGEEPQEEVDNSIKIYVVYNSEKQDSDWEANEDPARDGTTPDSAFYYIQSAIHWIEVNGNGNEDYTIKLIGYSATEAFDQTIVYGDNICGKANSITITSYDKNNFAIRSSSYKTINLKTIYGYNTVPTLIFKDIKISTNNGAIIYGEDGLRDTTKIQLYNNTVFKGETDSGCAIVLDGGGTIEMYGNSQIETFENGAVTMSYGYFHMKDKSTIYKCSTSYGGAFYLNHIHSYVYINDEASITECEAENDGGAVYMTGGTFEMNGGSITKCKANVDGGAIYMRVVSNSPNVYLNGGKIINNTATNNGAAIYAEGPAGVAVATINISDSFVIDQSEIYRVN